MFVSGQVLDIVAVRAKYRQGMSDLLQGLKAHVERGAATSRFALKEVL